MAKESAKESSLEEMKKDYEKLKSKYSLPSFKELNEEFDIEKAAEHETDCLIREVRKLVMEKVVVYLRFIETLLNPSNAPMFFFALVKGLTASDKKLLEKLYDKLGSFEIGSIELDCNYNEKNEVEFIKKILGGWKDIKEEMLKLTEILKRNWNQKSGKDERGYFG